MTSDSSSHCYSCNRELHNGRTYGGVDEDTAYTCDGGEDETITCDRLVCAVCFFLTGACPDHGGLKLNDLQRKALDLRSEHGLHALWGEAKSLPDYDKFWWMARQRVLEALDAERKNGLAGLTALSQEMGDYFE